MKKQVEKNKPIVIIRQNKEDMKIKTRIDDKSRKLKVKMFFRYKSHSNFFKGKRAAFTKNRKSNRRICG